MSRSGISSGEFLDIIRLFVFPDMGNTNITENRNDYPKQKKDNCGPMRGDSSCLHFLFKSDVRRLLIGICELFV